MNGNSYLLDTNAIIALLQGDIQIFQYLQDAQWIGISIISQIEFLVFPDLSESDKEIWFFGNSWGNSNFNKIEILHFV